MARLGYPLPLNLGMAQSLKRKASTIFIEPEPQWQAVVAQPSTSATHSLSDSDLPLERHNIDSELLDLVEKTTHLIHKEMTAQ